MSRVGCAAAAASPLLSPHPHRRRRPPRRCHRRRPPTRRLVEAEEDLRAGRRSSSRQFSAMTLSPNVSASWSALEAPGLNKPVARLEASELRRRGALDQPPAVAASNVGQVELGGRDPGRRSALPEPVCRSPLRSALKHRKCGTRYQIVRRPPRTGRCGRRRRSPCSGEERLPGGIMGRSGSLVVVLARADPARLMVTRARHCLRRTPGRSWCYFFTTPGQGTGFLRVWRVTRAA